MKSLLETEKIIKGNKWQGDCTFMVTVIFISSLIGQPGIDESSALYTSLVSANEAIAQFTSNKPANADVHRAWIEA